MNTAPKAIDALAEIVPRTNRHLVLSQNDDSHCVALDVVLSRNC